jgi:ACS family sodium-dependent inorganic phosphate cotransporter
VGRSGEMKSISRSSTLENVSGKLDLKYATEAVNMDSHGGPMDPNVDIPWRAFLRSRPVQALMFTHFSNNWFHYTMLAWLPTYFTDTLSVDLLHAAQTALLPPLAGVAASAAAGPMADALISLEIPLSTVRKLAQCTAFLVPSFFLLGACTPFVHDSTNLTVASITLALGISSFSLAGLYCTHQDLSPKYASAMLGLTNTAGAVPGIVGVITVGMLFDATDSWELSLFVPSAVLMLLGAAVYTFFCSNDPLDFDNADNKPFAWEARLQQLRSSLSSAWRKRQS